MNSILIVVVVCSLLFFPVLGVWVGGMRNRGMEGFLLGLLLGPLGVLIAALLPRGDAAANSEAWTEIASVVGGGIAMALPILFVETLVWMGFLWWV